MVLLTDEEIKEDKKIIKQMKNKLNKKNEAEFNKINRVYDSIQSRTKNSSKSKLKIHEIKKTWLKSKFIKWYEIKKKKGCYYCKTPIGDLEFSYEKTKEVNKRSEQRGWSLEVDRKTPGDLNYNEGNCVLSCYWCNNAKTDVFNENEALEIGKIMNKIIKNRKDER